MSDLPSDAGVGEFADGRTAAAHAVRVDVEGECLVVRDAHTGAERARWTLRGVHVDAMQEGGVYFVRHESERAAALSSRDPQLLAALRARATRGRYLPGGARPAFFALACLGGIVALGAALYAGAPHLARWAADRVPLDVERTLGAQVELMMKRHYCDDADAAVVLRALATRLDPVLGARVQLHVIDWKDVNALTLPGGHILVTRGLLTAVQSGDEVAGVLAHELQHVMRRHMMTRLVRGALLSGAWAIAVGDYTGLMAIDPTTAYDIANLRFSRQEEEEADAGAVALLERAGIRTGGLSEFFRRIEKDTDDVPRWLSTHPPSAERSARIDAESPDATPAPALTEGEMQTLRAACADREDAED